MHLHIKLVQRCPTTLVSRLIKLESVLLCRPRLLKSVCTASCIGRHAAPLGGDRRGGCHPPRILGFRRHAFLCIVFFFAQMIGLLKLSALERKI